jgi:hypothetical protein
MPVGRGDVNDAAAALACHRTQFVLHAQEYPQDVRVMNGPEVFDGGVLDDAERAFDAGIVHGNVETAESRDRCVDEVADVVLLLNVGPNELCLGAKRSQLRDKVFPLVVVAARNDHIGAFAGERHSSGAADAGEGAGNENNLLSHLLSFGCRGISADVRVVLWAADAIVDALAEGFPVVS